MINPKKLRKVAKHLGLEVVIGEVNGIAQHLLGGLDSIMGYHPHLVKMNGKRYTACDAKVVNRYHKQNGRGKYRHLFDGDVYAGLAMELDRGTYRWLT